MPPTYLQRVLEHQPTPDFSQILRVLQKGAPDRPTLFEFFLNWPLYLKLAKAEATQPTTAADVLKVQIAAFRQAGYDYVTYNPSAFCFPAGELHRERTISLNDGVVIRDRPTFEAYTWIEPDACDYSGLDIAAKELPDGMKVIMHGPGGVLENVIRLMGYDNLCFMLADDPELATEVFDAVGSRLVRHYEIGCTYDAVGACISNDDWGFKTQPMLSPEDLRTYVFPWHRRIVEAIHGAGRPAILHSCGNAAEIMDDIIDGIGFDGKHSFEDTIQPVEQAYEAYAGRVALLGGIDVDFVVRSAPDAVYRRSREMLERAGTRGGYALGTGNSVPEYVPQEHYAAMVWAAVEAR